MAACAQVLAGNCVNFLTCNVEHVDINLTGFGNCEADRRGRIEWVRAVLSPLKMPDGASASTETGFDDKVPMKVSCAHEIEAGIVSLSFGILIVSVETVESTIVIDKDLTIFETVVFSLERKIA